MSEDKPTIPRTQPVSTSESSEALQIEEHKTERAKIDGGAKGEVAKLQVAKEAISTVNGVIELFKSYNELEEKRTEWGGRVEKAEIDVRKAQVALDKAREDNRPRMEALHHNRKILDPLLEMFDEFLREMKAASLGDESRAKLREYLIKLSEQLVQMKS